MCLLNAAMNGGLSNHVQSAMHITKLSIHFLNHFFVYCLHKNHIWIETTSTIKRCCSVLIVCAKTTRIPLECSWPSKLYMKCMFKNFFHYLCFCLFVLIPSDGRKCIELFKKPKKKTKILFTMMKKNKKMLKRY